MNNEFCDDIEKILNNLRKNAIIMSKAHKKRYLFLKSSLKYYRIPVILISSLNSVGAVSFQNFVPQSYISLGNMFLSLLVGVIGSIELYFGVSKNAEIELISGKDFYVLATDIYKILSLDRSHRLLDANNFLNECYSRYIKLCESSCILQGKIQDHLTVIDMYDDLNLPKTISTDVFSDTSSEENIL